MKDRSWSHADPEETAEKLRSGEYEGGVTKVRQRPTRWAWGCPKCGEHDWGFKRRKDAREAYHTHKRTKHRAADHPTPDSEADDG